MKNLAALAEEYYTLLSERKVQEMEKYLHPEVHFKGPLAEQKGKNAVLDYTKNFASFFTKLTIREKFERGEKAMIVYDVETPVNSGSTPASVLVSFKDGLITGLELFYDARPFVPKKDEIFR